LNAAWLALSATRTQCSADCPPIQRIAIMMDRDLTIISLNLATMIAILPDRNPSSVDMRGAEARCVWMKRGQGLPLNLLV